jgi:hypothetical protein
VISRFLPTLRQCGVGGDIAVQQASQEARRFERALPVGYSVTPPRLNIIAAFPLMPFTNLLKRAVQTGVH